MTGKVESSTPPLDQNPVPYWLALRDKYKTRIYWFTYLTPLIVATGFALGRRFVKSPGFQTDWYWGTVYFNALLAPIILAFMTATDRQSQGFIEKLGTFMVSGFCLLLAGLLAFGLVVNLDRSLR